MPATARRPTPRVAAHTASGAAFTTLVLEVFRLNGALLAAGNVLCEGTGLTSARWQILGAVALAHRPVTVAQVARTMGQSRQAVHRIVEEMEHEKLLERVADPTNKRALPVMLSPRGAQLYEEMTRRQRPWANAASAGIAAKRIEGTVDFLRTIADRLDGADSAGSGAPIARRPRRSSSRR